MSFSIELNISELPIWKGISKQPGTLQTAPFKLGWSNEGFMRQLTDSATQSRMVEAYGHNEYNFITAPPGHSAWANRLAKQYLDFITKHIPNISDMQVLDIGGGSTFIADELASTQWNAKNCVIVDPAVRENPRSAKVRIIRDYFPPQEETIGKFDLIICLNCLEHVDDPGKFMTSIHQTASGKDAHVVLVFPDVENQFRTGDLNALLHEHISCFTMASAKELMIATKFEILFAESVDDCLYFHLKTTTTKCDSQVKDMTLIDGSRKLMESIDYIKEELGLALGAGKRVAFHGATNGLNNLLYLTGFANHPDILIYDGDDTKTGGYLPTCPNPIRHSSDVSYREIDTVFISAMTFYKECAGFINKQHGIPFAKIKPISPNFKAIM